MIYFAFHFYKYFKSSRMNQTVESVSSSLFREYLYRNNYRSTLEAFDREVPRISSSITNRYYHIQFQFSIFDNLQYFC